MPFIDLTLMKYVPGQAIPLGFAAVDTGAKVIRINAGNYPLSGGKVEIFSIIPYAVGESTNAAVAAQIAQGDNNASDGKITLLIKRPDLDNDFTCSVAAANEVDLKSQPEIILVITTREFGWELGDEARFIDDNANPPINILLTVQNINEQPQGTIGMVDDSIFTITLANYIVNATNLFAKGYTLSALPNLRPGATFV